jgi:molybdate transport system substrate-binding protein
MRTMAGMFAAGMLAVGLLLLVGACGGGDDKSGSGAPMVPAENGAGKTADKSSDKPGGKPVATGQIVDVMIAASTQDAMKEIIDRLEKEHGLKLRLNSGASSTLATQIMKGAPADIFISADAEWAEQVAKKGMVDEQVALLTNRLVIAVPKGNPAGIYTPEDLLAEKCRKIALAGELVPVAKYAASALKELGLLDKLTPKVVRAQDVRGVRAFVESGEVEAGVIYATDARGSQKLEVACDLNLAKDSTPIEYRLVLLKRDGRSKDAAMAYRKLSNNKAMETFEKYGFVRWGARAAG